MLKLLFLTLLKIPRCDRTLSSNHRTLSPNHRTLSPKNPLFHPVKNDRKEEGFSILEVLVTILVMTGFILGSLQATLLATVMRIQAQDKQEAANWIQQDLELIRYQAFMLDNGTADTATCGKYGLDLLNDTTLGLLQPTSSPRFPGVISPTTPVAQQRNINGKNYDVFRVYSHNNSNILQVNYTVAYASTHPRYKSGGNNVVTTLSTEVLPNAALACN